MEILSNINLNKTEILNIIFKNILKLLERRDYIKKNFDDKKNLEDFIENKIVYFEENKKLSIHFYDNEIKNITTGSVIDDYLNKKVDYHKFIICKNFTKKVYTQFKTIYKNAEIFFTHEFMEDIPSKVYIPHHQLLNDKDKEDLLSVYKPTHISKIYESDFMVRYYGGKINDIFRITRNNIVSGNSIFYRIVIKGTSNIIFL